MKTLEQSVKKFLNKKNKSIFCKCGQRQCHNLIYCRLCGKEFSKGYKSKTEGDILIYLENKPRKAWSISYWSAIFKDVIQRDIGKELTYKEIEDEVNKQLKIKC